MEDEYNIKLFDTQDIELKEKIDASKSSYEWRSDGKVVITMRKRDGPNYQKYLMKDIVKEAKEV